MTAKDAKTAPLVEPVDADPPPKYEEASSPSKSPAPAASAASPSSSAAAAAPSGPLQRRPPPPMDLPILRHLRANRVILASASPRRRALLAQAGLGHFEIWPSTLPEDLSKKMYGPFEYAAATARRKCMHVYQEALAAQAERGTATATTAQDRRDPELVIAADTVIVDLTGQILEKPRSAADHLRMLRHLRDTRTHKVLTSVCVMSPRRDAAHPGYAIAAHTEETTVVFARATDGLGDDVLEAYVRTREGADKAGGYALQGTGGLLLVERIEGCVDNVIGLPVRRTLQLAEEAIFQQGEEEVALESGDEE